MLLHQVFPKKVIDIVTWIEIALKIISDMIIITITSNILRK